MSVFFTCFVPCHFDVVWLPLIFSFHAKPCIVACEVAGNAFVISCKYIITLRFGHDADFLFVLFFNCNTISFFPRDEGITINILCSNRAWGKFAYALCCGLHFYTVALVGDCHIMYSFKISNKFN